ncbi:MAG: Mur ligase family protein, partial [Luminiphilus sp.]
MAQSQPGASLDAWLAHLETLHPQKIDLELLRVRTVAQRLGLLPAAMTTITVAGTNGKGSCVAALAALLKARGYLVGCYTSPHLLNFNERITIDQTPASDGEIITAFEAIEDSRQDISLSYFEFATLASLYLFKRAGVDFQVLEVGLGGRLDAVNIVDASACVITSIGVDHTEWLGDTRELIAIEKAGVARAGRPAVVAEQD